MSQKQAISSTFYTQLVLIVTIVVSSVIGFNWAVNKIEETVDKKMAPFIAELNLLKKTVEGNAEAIADNVQIIDAVAESTTAFLESYNKMYHKVFLKPADILCQPYKRRQRR